MASSSATLIPAYTIDSTAPDFTFEKATDIGASLTQAIDSHEDADFHDLWAAISSDLQHLTKRVDNSRFLVGRSDNYLRDLDETVAMFEANYEHIERCVSADEPWTDDQQDKLKAWTGTSENSQYDDSLKKEVELTKASLAVAIDTHISLLDPSLLDERPARLVAESTILTGLPNQEDVRGGRWDVARRHERERRDRAHSLAWPDIQHIPSVEAMPDARVRSRINELREFFQADSPSEPTTPKMGDMLELLDDDTTFPREKKALGMLPSVIASFLTVDLDEHTKRRTSFTDRQRDLLLSAWGGQAEN